MSPSSSAGDSEFPLIADVTADFVYARIMGTERKGKAGLFQSGNRQMGEARQEWAKGGAPKDLPVGGEAGREKASRCFPVRDLAAPRQETPPPRRR